MKKLSIERRQVATSSPVHFVARVAAMLAKISRRRRVGGALSGLLVCSLAVFGIGVTSVASASGNTLWVSSAPASPGDGNGCNKPDYSSIQAALNAAASGATLLVCGGTYAEQLNITKNVTITTRGPVRLKLPVAPVNGTNSCDTLPSVTGPPQSAISICGPITATVNNLTVEAKWPAGTCHEDLMAIRVEGGALLQFNDSAVTAAGPSPFNDCFGSAGYGMLIGTRRSTPKQVGHAEINHSSVSGYEKAGIVVSFTGSTATVNDTDVTGAGPLKSLGAFTGQQGVVATHGGRLTMNHGTISGNECDGSGCGPDFFNQVQAPGVLFSTAGAGSSLNGTTVSGNDQGIYYLDQSASGPTSPTVTITNTNLTGNRYFGMSLDGGMAMAHNLSVLGGNVGLLLAQYDGQTSGTQATVNNLSVRQAAVAGIQVLSDQVATDLPGSVTVKNARINSNSVPVSNNSSNFTLTLRHVS